MEKWVTRICRALMLGLAWAAVWVPFGVIAARFIVVGELDPEHIGGPLYAGFACGTTFSALAGIAAGRRRLAQVSFARASVLGAVSGVLPITIVFFLSNSDVGGGGEPWSLYPAVVSTLALVSAVSAVVSVWIGKQIEAPRRSSAEAGKSGRQ